MPLESLRRQVHHPELDYRAPGDALDLAFVVAEGVQAASALVRAVPHLDQHYDTPGQAEIAVEMCTLRGRLVHIPM